MTSFFTPTFFSTNRQNLYQKYGKELVILAGNGLLQRGGDTTYPFTQDANFWYLTGISEPDLVLVIDEDETYIIVPERTASREAFDGGVSASDVQSASGVTAVYSETEGWLKLTDRIRSLKQYASVAVPPAYIEQLGLYTNPARRKLHTRLHAAAPSATVTDIGSELIAMRAIKQPEELTAIQAAISVTTETLVALTSPETLSQFHYEYEIEAAITSGFRSRGAAGHAFEPIVASGQHACTLHYIANNAPLRPSDLVILDIGAEIEHYAADISRTYALQTPSTRQTEIYSAVCDIQDYARNLLRPGVLLHEYEKEVRMYLGTHLQRLGLITSLKSDAINHYYPHATSHFLGLNVHDVGEYSQPLTPGMVLTVEPGIYIPEEGIGIRIEDDVLITNDGCRVLSDQLPRSLF